MAEIIQLHIIRSRDMARARGVIPFKAGNADGRPKTLDPDDPGIESGNYWRGQQRMSDAAIANIYAGERYDR